MKTSNTKSFKLYYEQHHQHLLLKGLQPKTIDAYLHAIRRIGEHCEGELNALSHEQLVDYFSQRLASSSWSTVKLDLYGLKFFYTYVLEKPWHNIPLIKPPKVKRIPDILSQTEVQQLLMATQKLSYRVFFYLVQPWITLKRRNNPYGR